MVSCTLRTPSPNTHFDRQNSRHERASTDDHDLTRIEQGDRFDEFDWFGVNHHLAATLGVVSSETGDVIGSQQKTINRLSRILQMSRILINSIVEILRADAGEVVDRSTTVSWH